MKIIKYLSCLITTLTLSAVLIFDNAEALTNHINVEIYVDQGIVSKSGSVVTNVNGYVGGVYGFYYSKFGINVDFNFVANGEHILASTADSCLGATNYTGVCSHGTNAVCSNSGPLHHNNRSVIMNNFNVNATSDRVVLYLSGHILCAKGLSHYGVLGTTWVNDNRMIVAESDRINASGTKIRETRSTVAHEIGHLYGITDHYNTIYGDDRDNCMWGANYSNESVINNMLICNTCKNTITNNKSRYNHS